MTAKQKANRERFKSAIAEAAKIRAKNPKLTQAEAVKKAWAIIYSKKSKVGAVGETKKTTIYKGFKIIKGSYVSDYDNLKYSYTVLDKQNYQPFKRQNYFKTISEAKKEIDRAFGNYGLIFSGIKKTAKKTAKKSPAKSEYHADTKSHNVNIRVMSGIKLSTEEIKFLESESKNATGYNYRAKIIFGQECVLKETKIGTPVKKWSVDNMEKAKYLADELNKNKKYKKIKSGKI